MPQRAKGLTAAFVEKGTKPGRYGDGAGLYLLVRSREAKFWVFRYTRGGKMREMGWDRQRDVLQCRSWQRAPGHESCTRSCAKAVIRLRSATPRPLRRRPTRRKLKPAR